MDSLQNNDNYNNNLQSSQSFQNDQSSSNILYNTSNYIDYYSSTMNNDIVPTSYTQQQQPTLSFAGDENATTGTSQPLSHAPQYMPHYDSYNYNSYDISSRSLNMMSNSFQNYSEVFRFEIPGFKIIIIPNSSPYSSLYSNLGNLDIPNQVFTSPNVVIDNLQTQFQQNLNESFNNFNIFHG